MPRRRQFIKQAGVASTIASVGIAGCTGSQDGGGSDGGGGGDGGSQSGDGGSTSGGGSRETITVTTAPINVDGLVGTYMKEEGVMQEKLDAVGFDADVKLTWDGPSLFASNNAQVSNISVTEGARMAKERDFKLVSGGRIAASYAGWFVKRGSKWDPANTGGVQATIDKFAEEQPPIAIHSWSIGFIPVDKIVFDEMFGYNFSPDNPDFNVVTADLPAQPQLLLDDEIVAMENSPTHGAAPLLQEGEDSDIVPLFWQPAALEEIGYGTAPLVNNSCRQSFYDEHPDAFQAVIESWDEGMSWFFENAEDLMAEKKWREFFSLGDNQPAAEYAARWVSGDPSVPFATDADTFYEDVLLTDEYIDQVTQFMNTAAESNLEPTDWQDHITMVQF